MNPKPFVRQFATQFFVHQFADTGACFLLLTRRTYGIVPFYSSSREQSRTLGHEEANYHTLVSQSTPTTPAQIVVELDSYAATVKAPLVEAPDWLASDSDWPFKQWRNKSGLHPEVFLADARTNLDIAMFCGFQTGTREIHAFKQALLEARSK